MRARIKRRSKKRGMNSAGKSGRSFELRVPSARSESEVEGEGELEGEDGMDNGERDGGDGGSCAVGKMNGDEMVVGKGRMTGVGKSIGIAGVIPELADSVEVGVIVGSPDAVARVALTKVILVTGMISWIRPSLQMLTCS